MVRIPNVDGNGEAVLGWIAHSSYLGAIPREQRVRGIRARAGNIQIGGDAVFRRPLYRGTPQPVVCGGIARPGLTNHSQRQA